MVCVFLASDALLAAEPWSFDEGMGLLVRESIGLQRRAVLAITVRACLDREWPAIVAWPVWRESSRFPACGESGAIPGGLAAIGVSGPIASRFDVESIRFCVVESTAFGAKSLNRSIGIRPREFFSRKFISCRRFVFRVFLVRNFGLSSNRLVKITTANGDRPKTAGPIRKPVYQTGEFSPRTGDYPMSTPNTAAPVAKLTLDTTVQEALVMVSTGQVTMPAYLEWDALMKARVASQATAAASKGTPQKLSFKVSEKGGVSVYGFGKWPVTLYGEQWARLLAVREQLEAFIEANKASLKTKGETAAN